MILNELIELLEKIRDTHPESGEALVWAYPEHDSDGRVFTITYVGFDKKHKPSRIKLEG